MNAEPALRIVQVGFATTVQDHGRVGLAHLGVPTGGAVDRRTHDLVNRLVGNPPGAATIETMGALIVEALRPVVVASSTDASRQTLAAGYTCVYPSPSPGGWYLIGRTTAPMWDAERTPPALLCPGQSVRFRRVVA